MRDLAIFGSGGHAREVHQLVEDINRDKLRWNFVGFLDSNRDVHGESVHGFPVLGDECWLSKHPQTALVIAVGNPASRMRIVERLTAFGHELFATLIHPAAWVGNRVEIGPGTMICAGTVVTTDVRIGRHVIVNVGCSVSHDSVLEDYATLAPGVRIPGNVRVGVGAELGVNAAVIPGRNVGSWCILGAGAVAINDVPPNTTAVGVPARVVAERSSGWHLVDL